MNIILFSTIIITNLTIFVAKMFGYKEGLIPKSATVKHLKCKDKDGNKATIKLATVPLFLRAADAEEPEDEGFIGFRGGAESIHSLTGKAFQEGYAGKKEGNTEMKKKKEEKETMKNKKPNQTGAIDEEEEDDEDDDDNFKNIKEDIAESEALTKSLRKNNISKDTEKEIKKMLKGTDLKNLDTNELIQQQKGLMDAMKNMDPLIKNVNDMITNLKNSPISGFMGLGK
jgi:flagellin-like hook-associated protein FlgL